MKMNVRAKKSEVAPEKANKRHSAVEARCTYLHVHQRGSAQTGICRDRNNIRHRYCKGPWNFEMYVDVLVLQMMLYF